MLTTIFSTLRCPAGSEWAFSLTVESGGIINGLAPANLQYGGKRAEVNIQRGKWVRLEHVIDLDDDVIWLLIDSWYAHHWKFSSQETQVSETRQFGGINFYPLDSWNEFHLDNFRVERLSENRHTTLPINGDFEEGAAGLHVKPLGWDHVPAGDVHSLISTSGDSLVDVVSEEYGIAKSGMKFVAGTYSQDADGHITQSGISQQLHGLPAGGLYTLGFYQSVFLDAGHQDPSGSWMVVLNDSLIGVSEVNRSSEASQEEDLNWTYQEMTFRASGPKNRLKFLPVDDDENIQSNDREGIIMGLDWVTVWPLLTAVKETPPIAVLECYPNPAVDRLHVKHGGSLLAGDLRIYDLHGRPVGLLPVSSLPDMLVVDVSGLARGMYLLSFGTAGRSAGLFYKR